MSSSLRSLRGGLKSVAPRASWENALKYYAGLAQVSASTPNRNDTVWKSAHGLAE